MTAIAAISPDEMAVIDTGLSDIPPLLLLANATADQTARWHGIKTRYSILRQGLKAYFSGESFRIEGMSKKEREFFAIDRDYWLEFYKLIQYCWDAIEDHAKVLGASLEEVGISTPGQCLIAVLEQTAMMHLEPAYSPYWRWTPSEKRKQLKTCREAVRLINLRDGGTVLTVSEQNTVKQAEKIWKRTEEEIGRFQKLEQFCIEACMSMQADHRVKKYLKAWNQLRLDRLALLESTMLHPRKKLKGEEWRNGQRFPMGQHGGVPLNKTS